MASRALQRVRITRDEPVVQVPDIAQPVNLDCGFARMKSLTADRPKKVSAVANAPASENLLWAVLHAFDVLGIGWIACDVDGHILGINQTADTIVKTHEGLEIDSHGRLRTTFGATGPLTEAIARATQPRGFWESRVGVTLAVRRQSKRPLALVVHPVQRASRSNPGRPMALLLTLDSSACAVTSKDLCRLFRLTPSESGLALLMMEGRILEDCCSELGISRALGKSALRQLLKKTRARHQTELVLTLFKTAAVARLSEQSFEASAFVDEITVQ